MSITLAFDVYGTLIDTHGLDHLLTELIGEQAKSFSQTWREKQLEYSFRRGLMQNYENFAVCTEQALDYTCVFYQKSLSKKEKQHLLDSYQTLPAFADVKLGLQALTEQNFKLYAFSNGQKDTIKKLLSNAAIQDFFLDIITVDDVKSFKPSPAVYAHFLKKAGVTHEKAWLISSNPFDVIGAIASGLRAVWISRASNAVFDPWGIEPTLTINNLQTLADVMKTMPS